MHRFFVPPSWIQPPLVHFQGKIAQQIARVLRLAPGEVVTVLDGSLLERQVRLTVIEREVVEGLIIAESTSTREPRLHLSLYIGMTQRVKFEWILQKGTELGVATFVPVISSRSLVQETTAEARKLERWEGILREAAEQCARGRIPVLRPPMPFAQALVDGKAGNQLSLIAWEKETGGNLKDRLSLLKNDGLASIAGLVGPEGGFSEEEAGQAMAAGWQPISLGGRILRMETAALTLAALIMYELGELNQPGGAAAGS
jgi:16S rRNA (uracil1498-N3)-methyltransferase